jgi:hypothetical protein
MIDKFTLNLQDTSTHTSQRRRKPTYRNGLPKNTLAKNFPLLNLYPEILMMVMDRLPVQDIVLPSMSTLHSWVTLAMQQSGSGLMRIQSSLTASCMAGSLLWALAQSADASGAVSFGQRGHHSGS